MPMIANNCQVEMKYKTLVENFLVAEERFSVVLTFRLFSMCYSLMHAGRAPQAATASTGLH